jgi:L-histidine Nalpha-methyltransferase
MSTGSISAEIERRLIDGLTQEDKFIPCEYCYNEVGSALFQDLCEEPDYYLSRTERSLLAAHRAELMGLLRDRDVLELGAGDCSKMIKLSMDSAEVQFSYFPNDIDESILRQGVANYRKENPTRMVKGIPGEYYDGLRDFSTVSSGGKAILFLGSTIGNFDKSQRVRLFDQVQSILRSGDLFYVACDTFKSMAKINRAYNGASRIVKQIELNTLCHLNGMYRANFEVRNFTHHCDFNPKSMFLESRLFALCDQHIVLEELGIEFDLMAGNSILMDKMWKPTKSQFKEIFNASIWDTELDFADDASEYHLVVARMK